MTSTTQNNTSPATLVAILVAARRSGDRDLERHARDRLKNEHGIKVSFARQDGKEVVRV